MNYHDFYEKLSPFFTDEQIEELNEYGFSSHKDAFGADYGAQGFFEGRDFVCNMLYDIMDENAVENVKNIFGIEISQETADELTAQMDIEW